MPTHPIHTHIIIRHYANTTDTLDTEPTNTPDTEPTNPLDTEVTNPLDTELINTLALARLSYFHLPAMLSLYLKMGSATEVVNKRHELPTLCPGLPARVADDLAHIDIMRQRAEEELAWAAQHDVKVLTLNDPQYPYRLKETPDAPLVLFYKGTADLNACHIINIVGTRHSTPYGEDLIRRFVADLRTWCPDTLIISGLAYGIDIHAHRQALSNGMDTVAVLAHGLDTIYPQRHRDTASEMVLHGGLVTEYMTRTQPDKINFVRRNRITAGLCDATILVESAAKGGGLITTRIAKEYNRDVFAFPGPVGAPYSEGCNRLIRDCGASLITSAEDFVNAMGWADDAMQAKARRQGIERQMFPDLDDNEQRIVQLLSKNNDLRQDIIAVRTALSTPTVMSLLFQLEMKGVVKAYAGGVYHLLA